MRKEGKKDFWVNVHKTTHKMCYINYKSIYKITLKIIILFFTTQVFYIGVTVQNEGQSKLLIGHHRTFNLVIWLSDRRVMIGSMARWRKYTSTR